MIKHTYYRESLYRKGSIGYGLELARENIRNNGGSKVGYPESSVDILPFICEWCAFFFAYITTTANDGVVDEFLLAIVLICTSYESA